MRTADRGFTLLETVISIGVFAAGVVTMSHLVSVCVSTNAIAHHRTIATLVAQQKLEQLRAEQVLGEMPVTGEYLDGTGAVLCGRDARCAGAVYLREWSVQGSAVAASALFIHVHARRANDASGGVHLISVRPRVGG
jgi:Tfp pilus assembly protein PilV